MSAPAFKRHMDHWLERGYVRPDRVEGKSEWVRLSGEAAVAFTALTLERGEGAMALLGGAES